MSIRIVTDSTCNLPGASAGDAGITVMPMLIQVGEQAYLDGIDLARQEFYARLPEYLPYPIPVIPAAETFAGVYRRLAGIVHSNAPQRVDDLLRKAQALLPPGDIPVVDITPVVGVHTGPGAVGFACVAKG